MIKTVTYADLERFLVQLGFVAEQAQHTYQLFTYASPEVLIVLPVRRADELVDAAHLLAVRKQVVENGLLDERAFDRRLGGVEPTAAAQ
jgi:hypothetical protein